MPFNDAKKQAQSNLVSHQGPVASAIQPAQFIALIEEQLLVREALGSIFSSCLDQPVATFSSLAGLLQARADKKIDLCILRIDAENLAAQEPLIERLFDQDSVPSLAIISDCSDLARLKRLFHLGIRGYIPASLPLNVAMQVLRLIQAGGIYAPGELIFCELPQSVQNPAEERGPAAGETLAAIVPVWTEDNALAPNFTPRQKEVLDALRKGKSNKIIAYELNMSEGTVKVHVKSIMRKLNATNRTEAAFLISEWLKGAEEGARAA